MKPHHQGQTQATTLIYTQPSRESTGRAEPRWTPLCTYGRHSVATHPGRVRQRGCSRTAHTARPRSNPSQNRRLLDNAMGSEAPCRCRPLLGGVQHPRDQQGSPGNGLGSTTKPRWVRQRLSTCGLSRGSHAHT